MPVLGRALGLVSGGVRCAFRWLLVVPALNFLSNYQELQKCHPGRELGVLEAGA